MAKDFFSRPRLYPARLNKLSVAWPLQKMEWFEEGLMRYALSTKGGGEGLVFIPATTKGGGGM